MPAHSERGAAATLLRARGEQHELPGRCACVVLTRPTDLLEPRCAPLREALIEVSDQAFGTNTADTWQMRFDGDFFGRLRRFYLVFGANDALIGWSGYRARTIRRERVVYFDSTGLLPAHQGHGLIPLIQRVALAFETLPHRQRPINLVVRTRNPAAYRLAIRTARTEPVIPSLDGTVPKPRRALVAETALWLGQHPFDPTTGRVTDAYRDRPALYGPGRCAEAGDPRINRLFASIGPADAILLFARHAPHSNTSEPEAS